MGTKRASLLQLEAGHAIRNSRKAIRDMQPTSSLHPRRRSGRSARLSAHAISCLLHTVAEARRPAAALLATVLIALGAAPRVLAQPDQSQTAEPRSIQPLASGWRFVQDDLLTDEAALAATGDDWQSVTLPHTWNAQDAAGTHVTVPYKRGRGFYRLAFDAMARGGRHWLQFDGASLVADVWLNGSKLGQHKGAFTTFRFDVTDLLRPKGNLLVVKTDNSAPKTESDLTAIAPLSGDFNVSGGLYRMVSLVSTSADVHVALDDLGGSGVYARTTGIADPATVNVRVKLSNDGPVAGTYTVRAALMDAAGRLAGEARTAVALAANGTAEASQDLGVAQPHLWQGIHDPYLYTLQVEVLDERRKVLDRVSQRFGIRQMSFDPDDGFFLNGRSMPLHGVAMHQDYLGKGWAIADRDTDESLALVQEIGANTIRLAHYPHASHTLQRADEMGLVVWAEVPFVNGVRLSCSEQAVPPTSEFSANLEQQLRELIRQQYNHPSIAMWSIGNENSMTQGRCDGPDNVTPTLRRLQEVAKAEDPGRPTTLADVGLGGRGEGKIRVGGITDVWALNRYYLWYYGDIDGLKRDLEDIHERYPKQPVGVSEYGAGAALSDHTDNPLGGPPTSFGLPGTRAYQPEEYAAWVHERNYEVLASRKYVWGTYVWAMFDFGSGIRNEGDLRGVNTKGLVSFDRKTRKEAFYFYKANWSAEPVTHIVGRRYTDRAYATTDVKVYSNAEKVELLVNGTPAGSRTSAQCPFKTCVFENVSLSPGRNVVTARGVRDGAASSDEVAWTLADAADVNIAAGQIATGFESSTGARYGSDNFFTGGVGRKLNERTFGSRGDATPLKGVEAPADQQLYATYRAGRFRYDIPLRNGSYRVTLGFVEPLAATTVGERVFDVLANGTKVIADLDVLREAGAYRTVLTRSLSVVVSNDRLELAFEPTRGEAVVSNLTITKQ
jgi:beta-galactosidase